MVAHWRIERSIVSSSGSRSSCHAHIDAGTIHHLEHLFQTLISFTHQPASTTIIFSKDEMGGAVSPLSHFLEIAGSDHVVEIATFRNKFGYYKSEMPLVPAGAPLFGRVPDG